MKQEILHRCAGGHETLSSTPIGECHCGRQIVHLSDPKFMDSDVTPAESAAPGEDTTPPDAASGEVNAAALQAMADYAKRSGMKPVECEPFRSRYESNDIFDRALRGICEPIERIAILLFTPALVMLAWAHIFKTTNPWVLGPIFGVSTLLWGIILGGTRDGR